MLEFAAVIIASLLSSSESFHFTGRGISRIHNLPTETQTYHRNIEISNYISRKNCATLSSRLLLTAVAKKSEGTPEGEKKPRAARKPKIVSDATALDGNVDEAAVIKKPVKAKATKAASETEKVTAVKKVKEVKATSATDASTKLPKVKTTKLALGAADKSIKDDFEGNDMFDLKELLGDDFLSEGEGLGLLPNLDEDLAKLEANLNELGDFGFDFRDDEDDDEALRSIESGKFDIEDFLKEKDGVDDADDLDLLSVLSDLGGKKGSSESLTLTTAKTKKVAEPNKKKKEKAVQPTLQQAMKGVQEDEDDDDEGLEDESVSDQVLEELALSLGLGGDDLMDVDFDGEDDEEPVKNLKKSLLDGSNGGGKDSLDDFDGSSDKDKQSSSPLIIDGMEVDNEGFELGVQPPPLEEFKRLMESLGPDSMFIDEYTDLLAVDEYVQPEAIPVKVFKEPNDRTKAWLPLVYEGGKSSRISSKPEISKSLDWWLIDHEGAAPSDWRVQVISVVTNSSNANTTALDMVNMVYDHIQRGLTAEENERVSFQILCYEQENGEPMEELEDSIQMWLESYNTYHLVDGAAMKEAWGSIMPHIMLAEKNLNAILDQVRWALAEDTFEGALLTPRLRRLRFRGGAQEMTTGFNTEQLDSEFSVVSVR